MPNLEWEVAHDLVTPGGTVLLNQPDAGTGRTFLVRPEGYSIVPSLRVNAENISQMDGSIPHPRYKTGLVATMTVAYLINEGGTSFEPACGADLREMHETLVRALNSIRRLGPSNQRLIWTPTGAGRRMLNDVQLLSWLAPEKADENESRVTFSLETPFPYAIDLTQTTTTIGTITNPGNADFFPVMHITGGAWTVQNASVLDRFGNPLKLVYDSTRPGAITPSGYAEVDFFRGTIFANGDGADLTAGIDPTVSDFFPMVPGSNSMSIFGGGAGSVLWNPAWA